MSAAWITLWNESAAHWGEAMWRACWQGGLLAAIVSGVCQWGRRLPASLRCGLWWLVCLKLLVGLCPILLALPLLPPVTISAPVATAQPIPFYQPSDPIETPPFPAELLPTVTEREASRARPPISGSAWLLAGWLAGVGVLMGITVFSLRSLHLLLRKAKPLSDPALTVIAPEAAAAMGLRAVPRLLVTEVDIGALTLGAWRPVVLLSQRTLALCSPSELRLILAHEFAHIRRGDVWLGLLPHLTQILFWFHPLAWPVCREFDLARESACDEQTLHLLKARSDLYARLLLKLGARHTSGFSLFTPGVSSHFRILHRRISMLQQMTDGSPRRLRGRVITLVCLAGAAVVVPWSIVHAQNSASKAPDGAAQEKGAQAGKEIPARRQAVGDTEDKNRAVKTDASNLMVKRLIGLPGDTIEVKPGTVLKNGKQVPASIVSRNGKPLPEFPDGKSADKTTAKPAVNGKDTNKPDPNAQTETTIFPLKYANAAEVVSTLTTLFEGEKAGKKIKIVADPRTNSILVRADAEKTREISKIVQHLDEEDTANLPESRTSVRIIPLKFAQADKIVTILTSLLVHKPEQAVKIVANSRTNSIIVSANEERTRQILEILAKLDTND